MNQVCLTPCRSARALEVLIFLLLILDAHVLLQSFFPDSFPRLPESLSEGECSSSPWELWRLVGLIGRGENVP